MGRITQGFKNVLNLVIASGKFKKWFWSKQKDFYVKIYYTPFKKIILSVESNGLDKESLPFKIGDHIAKFREWVEENGYKIELDKRKFYE